MIPPVVVEWGAINSNPSDFEEIAFVGRPVF